MFTLTYKYNHILIPFPEINGVYVLENFIFLTTSVSKDILIPLNIFETEIEKTEFLTLFKAFNIQYSFPSNYNFI